MIYHAKKSVLYWQLETTPGTPIAVSSLAVAANAGMPVYDLTFTPDVKREARSVESPSLQNIPGVHGAKSGKIKFKTDLFTSGAAGTAPAFDGLLLASWFKKTVVASTSVTYTSDPTGTNGGATQNTLTMAVGKRSNDGTKELLNLICGASASSWKLVADKIGNRLMIEWEFVGKVPSYAGILTPSADLGTILSAITYPDQVANLVRFGGLSATTGLWARQINNFTFDRKLSTELTVDTQDLSFYGLTTLANEDPTMTIDPYKVPVATFDDLLQFMNGGVQGSAGFTTGSTAGKIFTFTTPAVQATKVGDKAEGSQLRSAFELECTRTTTGIASDAFSLVFA